MEELNKRIQTVAVKWWHRTLEKKTQAMMVGEFAKLRVYSGSELPKTWHRLKGNRSCPAQSIISADVRWET